MIRALFIVALLALGALPAHAQNKVCPTAPIGDNTNKCASTAFVKNALTTGLPLTANHIYVGNGSNLATDVAVGGDCTITFGTPAVLRCPGTSSNGQVLANSSGAIVGLTNAQLTALINLATATLPGTVPAWPNNTTTYFRGDGTYASIAFSILTGQASLAQLPTLGANTVLGTIAGGTPIALTQTQLTSLINVFTTTLPGSVPAPGSITGKFLGDDGTWHTVSGTGTVTSAQLSSGNGITVTTTAGANPCVTTCNLTINQSLTNTTLQASPTNPTATSSAVGVMMGLGGTCKLTPAYSSRIKVEFIGDVRNGAISNTSTVKVYFGTSTAPTNGAATTGTQVANSLTADQATAAFNIPFVNGGIITGLTPGTPYWFDINLTASANTSTVLNLSCNAVEF